MLRLYKFQQSLNGFFLTYPPHNGGFPFIEGHLAFAFPDVSELGIGHFTGTVDYAAHNGNGTTFQV